MGLESLLAVLKNAPPAIAAVVQIQLTDHSVTSATARGNQPLQRKPAWALGCTPETSVTSRNSKGRAFAVAYHSHHFQCVRCQAAGRGSIYGQRCSVGMALWLAYCNQN